MLMSLLLRNSQRIIITREKLCMIMATVLQPAHSLYIYLCHLLFLYLVLSTSILLALYTQFFLYLSPSFLISSVSLSPISVFVIHFLSLSLSPYLIVVFFSLYRYLFIFLSLCRCLIVYLSISGRLFISLCVCLSVCLSCFPLQLSFYISPSKFTLSLLFLSTSILSLLLSLLSFLPISLSFYSTLILSPFTLSHYLSFYSI